MSRPVPLTDAQRDALAWLIAGPRRPVELARSNGPQLARALHRKGLVDLTTGEDPVVSINPAGRAAVATYQALQVDPAVAALAGRLIAAGPPPRRSPGLGKATRGTPRPKLKRGSSPLPTEGGKMHGNVEPSGEGPEVVRPHRRWR